MLFIKFICLCSSFISCHLHDCWYCFGIYDTKYELYMVVGTVLVYMIPNLVFIWLWILLFNTLFMGLMIYLYYITNVPVLSLDILYCSSIKILFFCSEFEHGERTVLVYMIPNMFFIWLLVFFCSEFEHG